MPEEDGARTIGEVIALLQDEFPDVTVSKLRFLESQGLIRPARSPSGYRLFGDEDIARIRFILQQQRDHFLPLKVIRSKLTMWERGEAAPTPGPAGPPPEVLFTERGEPVGRAELARRSGLGPRQIDELVEHGILRPLDPDATAFDADDVIVATEARRLLDDGLEPRHLRTVRLAVEREVELLRGLAEPLLRNRAEDARRHAAQMLADAADAIGRMRSAMMIERLRDLLVRR